MKLIHTADWHLCTRHGRIDRTDDLKARVEQVAKFCLEHEVELLIIAGDLFSERATNEQMTDAFRHLKQHFDPFFKRGGIILAVTGNHDRDHRLDLMRSGMGLAAPQGSRELQPGRMYVFNQRGIVTAKDRTGESVQFVLLPYPYPSRYQIDPALFPTREEQYNAMKEQIVQWMQKNIRDETTFRNDLPTVLIAHLHVYGAQIHKTYQMNPGDDIEFQYASLNPAWHYIALGHIHKPQKLQEADHIRYSGSIDRLDFGEEPTGQGVLLLDVMRGQAVQPIHLPIEPTAFAIHTLEDPACDLSAWAACFPERENTITIIRVKRPSPDRAGITATLYKLFPRLLQCEWAEDETIDEDQTGVDSESGTPASIIRRYLEQRIPADDPHRAALLNLAEHYTQQGEL